MDWLKCLCFVKILLRNFLLMDMSVVLLASQFIFVCRYVCVCMHCLAHRLHVLKTNIKKLNLTT
jgi:hypothetical protein